MTQPVDLLNHLAGIAPDSSLAAARLEREAATHATQGSYRALFGEGSADFPLNERHAVAAQVAAWHQTPALADHYAQQGSRFSSGERLSAALEQAERLTFQPVTAAPADLDALQQAGWTLSGIVTLSQLVAFVSFQSRLLQGLQLLNGRGVPQGESVPAGQWHTQPLTHDGRAAPVAFTQQSLGWTPWIAAKPLAQFNADEQATLARFGHTDSDYFRLLARNLPVLEQRTLTDKGIFYTAGGLPRAERELAATVASKVNGCIYCASVHARKAGQLSKQPEAVQQLLAVPPGQSLTSGQSPRWQAIIAFAAALSATPPVAGQQQVQALRDQGLDTLELLDLVQATAFFAWANRLMLTLGEPFLPADGE